MTRPGPTVLSALLLASAGCDIGTDAATRLAHDLDEAERRLGSETGARYTLRTTPSSLGQCTGAYTVSSMRSAH